MSEPTDPRETPAPQPAADAAPQGTPGANPADAAACAPATDTQAAGASAAWSGCTPQQPATPQGTQPVQPCAQAGSPCGQPPAQPYGQPAYGEAPSQPYGYAQQPQAAPCGYAQPGQPGVPPQQPPAPYGQPPTTPYGQQPTSPYGPPPAAPYGQWAYPQPPQQPPKKKVWPWVLGACFLVLLLGLGGCVGCVSCMGMAQAHRDYDDAYSRDHGDTYDDGRYDYDDGYDYPYDDSYDYYDGLSRSDVEDFAEAEFGALPNTVDGERRSPGIYEVGAGKDLEPGLYYLEGALVEENSFVVFEREGTDRYDIDDAVLYMGGYFAQLEPGDLIVFAGSEGSSMYPATQDALGVAAPYRSGVYRVGIDIPAGTYTVTADAEAAPATVYDSAVYVMKDLEFDDDSIVETKFVAVGGTQTVTVADGQYVELFAATMEPAAA